MDPFAIELSPSPSPSPSAAEQWQRLPARTQRSLRARLEKVAQWVAMRDWVPNSENAATLLTPSWQVDYEVDRARRLLRIHRVVRR